jgi:Carboxypeptidase regulatory-like domain
MRCVPPDKAREGSNGCGIIHRPRRRSFCAVRSDAFEDRMNSNNRSKATAETTLMRAPIAFVLASTIGAFCGACSQREATPQTVTSPSSTPGASPTTYTVFGRVVDDYSKGPITGARVRIHGRVEYETLESRTDAEGRYSLNGLVNRLGLFVTADGYHDSGADITVTANTELDLRMFSLVPPPPPPPLPPPPPPPSPIFLRIDGTTAPCGGVLAMIRPGDGGAAFNDRRAQVSWALNGETRATVIGVYLTK